MTNARTLAAPEPSRYADRRTAPAGGCPPAARGRPATQSPNHRPTTPPDRDRRPPPSSRPRGEPVNATNTADDPDVPTRLIDGHRHTTRAGITHLAGWQPGNSVNVRARTDPQFPHGRKEGREYWYAFDGEHGVDAYLQILAQRAEAKKPPPVKAGDPDELLQGAAAAGALHISRDTLRDYIRRSRPFWTGNRNGRPLLPAPDDETSRGSYTIPAWYRKTLAAHQKGRKGQGTKADHS